jgi:hypothetical protein
MTADNVHDRLDRFKNLIVDPRDDSRSSRLPSRYRRMADAFGGQLVRTEAGCFCLIRTTYPYGSRFGRLTLERDRVASDYLLSAFSSSVRGTVAPSSLLFLDTETTGLGGAGAVAFLVGCGSLTENGFEIRQYLLPDYSDEAAMLEAVLGELKGCLGIVSYNGVAFDMALLRSRMIINRVAKECDPEYHLDLLYPTRRLFKRRLGDCRLVNIERELLEFYRTDDIPSHLIPSVYFSWLSDENLDSMESVLEHNRLDIYSMHFLAEMIVGAFESDGESLHEVDDMFSLSRVYDRMKERTRALSLYKRITGGSGEGLPEDILLSCSLALKRSGDWDQALMIWRKLSLSDSREGYLANIELAKFFEHRVKDYRKARQYAERAKQGCPPTRTHQGRLDRRLARLLGRLKA